MGRTLRGRGRVELAAYGVADAEATVAKELKTIFPRASVEIVGLRRIGASARIVESFEVEFVVSVPIEELTRHVVESVEGGVQDRRALMLGRRAILGSRYERLVWEVRD